MSGFMNSSKFGRKLLFEEEVYEIVQMYGDRFAACVKENSEFPAEIYLVPVIRVDPNDDSEPAKNFRAFLEKSNQ